jgi:23S rRNA (guanosine2251-2'-O)-methyltransferase
MRKPIQKPNPHTRTEKPQARDLIPKSWRIVIGQHAINEVLQVRPKAILQAWLKQGWESSQDLRDLNEELKKLKIKSEIKPMGVLDRFGGHQGAALMLEEVPELNWAALESQQHSKLLILDGIEDPHNLGAILRTSWLMQVDGILIPADRSVGLSPGVHKVACGGAEHVPVEICPNFSNPLEKLKKMGYWVFGLSHLGKKTIFDLKLPEKVVWVVGAEDKGMRTTTERLCDELVSIPQVSAAASYNASVASAMALTETFRQHTTKKL